MRFGIGALILTIAVCCLLVLAQTFRSPPTILQKGSIYVESSKGIYADEQLQKRIAWLKSATDGRPFLVANPEDWSYVFMLGKKPIFLPDFHYVQHFDLVYLMENQGIQIEQCAFLISQPLYPAKNLLTNARVTELSRRMDVDMGDGRMMGKKHCLLAKTFY